MLSRRHCVIAASVAISNIIGVCGLGGSNPRPPYTALVAPEAPAAAATAPRATPSLPWQFSWDTLSVFAFPGAAPRFMTPTEVAYFNANFSMMLIWGLNATCYTADGSGATQPATCPDGKSVCNCPAPTLEQQNFTLNMEASLQAQGAALKAAGSQPVLGYIEGLSAQKYYGVQGSLMADPSRQDWLLSIPALGPRLVDCYKDGCNWQGVEYRQYDLTQAAVRDFYAQQVIGGLVNGSGLDGSFVDVIDWWRSSCPQWHCSDALTATLVNASLAALDAALATSAAAGKVLSVSSHTSLATDPDYYLQYAQLLAKYGNGMRFVEFFTADLDSLATLQHTTGVMGLPAHIHATTRTLAPDWVELAVFLLGAGPYSYFSYSGPWMLDSFAVYPEYIRRLGAPLGPAVNTTTQQPQQAWQLLQGLNLAYSLPTCPNCSTPGVVQALGTMPSAAACLQAVQQYTAAATAGTNATGMTWVPADGSEWALTCWARLDAFPAQSCVSTPSEGAPCYSSGQVGHVSAVSVPVLQPMSVWQRAYQHCNVSWWPTTGNATLQWS